MYISAHTRTFPHDPIYTVFSHNNNNPSTKKDIDQSIDQSLQGAVSSRYIKAKNYFFEEQKLFNVSQREEEWESGSEQGRWASRSA